MRIVACDPKSINFSHRTVNQGQTSRIQLLVQQQMQWKFCYSRISSNKIETNGEKTIKEGEDKNSMKEMLI